MSTGFRSILFAIRDASHVAPGALRKLAVLARGSGARLELYHALTEPVRVPRTLAVLDARADTLFEPVARHARRELERLARGAALRGLRVSVHVDWDYPAHEAVVRRARAIGADLVVGEAHAHRLAARPFLQNTDWELIRHCPQPLLLLKGGRRYDAANVLVAVDPFHAADKPASLDRALVASGQRTASALGGTLHLVHAWMPLAASLPTVASAPTPVYLPRDVEAGHEKQVRKAFDRLASRAGAKPAARHLVEGPVQGAIESAARRTRASIVVMGAISRRGLRRLFIGNTAERLLGHLDCDVLVVKPPGFRTQVPARGSPLPPKVLPLTY
ncbi:MAG: universal stress protein [Steroidobacteraceae bacterium]